MSDASMPLPPADRLDAWLRRQTGWRLGVLFWLQFGPPVVMACCAASSFFGNLTVIWPLAASVLVAALLFVPLRRGVSRRGRPLVPSWRVIAGEMFLLAGFLVSISSWNEPGRHTHRAMAVLGLVLWLIGFACFADTVRRNRMRSA